MTDSSQRLGTAMLVAGWLLGLGLLTVLFNYLLEKQHNPNQEVVTKQEGVREVILQRNRSGHYVATGTINGTKVTFFLDTGATIVAIPGRLADRLQLRQGPEMLVNTANGTVKVYRTEITHISLGNIELQRIRASINPQMQEDDVLLGMNFLKYVEFTQRGDKLILRQYSDENK